VAVCLLLSVHRAVIFAISQLSCFIQTFRRQLWHSHVNVYSRASTGGSDSSPRRWKCSGIQDFRAFIYLCRLHSRHVESCGHAVQSASIARVGRRPGRGGQNGEYIGLTAWPSESLAMTFSCPVPSFMLRLHHCVQRPVHTIILSTAPRNAFPSLGRLTVKIPRALRDLGTKRSETAIT